ncbi:DUF2742 domain-containing protein [Mycolicibacterium komossense]|uniref:DUF2742 domain-containing protein n=1 Tax=Mycolicibacterium komossense TaxID=1779 RepID=A0ABT3CLV5_9MYCO|nr:DUF2742 domain-containing protein [Mycolicibacterium komossense]MCV7230425.1 DUF2742 domain-containing protein [Mycolicibacterium komossense]
MTAEPTSEFRSSDEESPAQPGGGTPPSRQVSWYTTFTFAERYATNHDVVLDNLPIPGTPSWCGMSDDDARKLLALVLGGVREALAHDTVQEQLGEASRDVSQAAKWISDDHRFLANRGKSYIRRSA